MMPVLLLLMMMWVRIQLSCFMKLVFILHFEEQTEVFLRASVLCEEYHVTHRVLCIQDTR